MEEYVNKNLALGDGSRSSECLDRDQSKLYRGRLFIFLIDAFFYLFFYVVFGVIEFPDALADTSHEFRDLSASKKDQDCQYDQYPFSATRHADEKICVDRS